MQKDLKIKTFRGAFSADVASPASSPAPVDVMGFYPGGLTSLLTAMQVNVDAAVEYYGIQTEEFISEATVLSPLKVNFIAV